MAEFQPQMHVLPTNGHVTASKSIVQKHMALRGSRRCILPQAASLDQVGTISTVSLPILDSGLVPSLPLSRSISTSFFSSVRRPLGRLRGRASAGTNRPVRILSLWPHNLHIQRALLQHLFAPLPIHLEQLTIDPDAPDFSHHRSLAPRLLNLLCQMVECRPRSLHNSVWWRLVAPVADRGEEATYIVGARDGNVLVLRRDEQCGAEEFLLVLGLWSAAFGSGAVRMVALVRRGELT
jgi:hypothetical protein